MIDIGSLYTRIEADTSGLNKAETNIAAFAKKAAGYFAAVASVSSIATAIKDVTFATARYDTLGVVMNVIGRNANYTTGQMANYQKTLEKTGISAQSSRDTLIRMAQAQIDLSKSSELARIAQDAAVIGNINSSEAFERMVYGIQSGQIEVLKTIGINVNFENSYKKIASILNKTTNELTEQEKTQARTNAVVEQGTKIQGAYSAAMDTPMKKWLSLDRYVSNFKVQLGALTQDSFSVFVDKLTESLKALNSALSGADLKFWGGVLGDVTTLLFDFEKVVDRVKNKLGKDTILGKALDIHMDAVNNVKAAIPIVGQFTTAIDIAKAALRDNGESSSFLDKTAASVKNFYKATKESFMSKEEIMNLRIKEALQDGVADPWQSAAREAMVASKGMKDGVTRNLTELQKKYEDHANAIKKISDEIKENQLSGEELIRSIQQSGMSDLGKWQDLKKQAKEYAAESEKALKAAQAMKDVTSKEDIEKRSTFFEDAAKYADLAKNKYADLKGEIKNGDRVLISQKQSIQEAVSGVKAMMELKNEALAANKQMEAAAGNDIAKQINDQGGTAKLFEDIKAKSNEITMQSFPAMGLAFDKAWKDGAQSANVVFTNIDQSLNKTATKVSETLWAVPKDAAAGIETEVRKIGDTWTNVSDTAKKGSTENVKMQTADSKKIVDKVQEVGKGWEGVWESATKAAEASIDKMLDGIKKVQTEASKIKISEKSAGGSVAGYMLGGTIQALRFGGQAVHAAAGQYFPGYGGGDQIPAVLEAGEVVERKEAVREGGLDTALAFNNRDWKTVVQNLLPKLRMGGPVMPGFPRQAFAMGGPVQQVSQESTSESIRKYFIAGSPEPITVRADNRNGERIFAELQKRYLRRS